MSEMSSPFEPFLQPLDGRAEDLRAIIEPALWAIGLELVQLHDVRGAHKDTVRILTDRPTATATANATAKAAGVSMGDLERANRVISDVLDVEDAERKLFAHPYDLEVGSPGVDRPLTKISHFTKHAGECVKVKSNRAVCNARSFGGILAPINGGIRVDDVEIPYDAIASAHIVFVFQASQKPGKKQK